MSLLVEFINLHMLCMAKCCHLPVSLKSVYSELVIVLLHLGVLKLGVKVSVQTISWC